MRRYRADLTAMLARALTHGDRLSFPIGTFVTDGTRVWEDLPDGGQTSTEAPCASNPIDGHSSAGGGDAQRDRLPRRGDDHLSVHGGTGNRTRVREVQRTARGRDEGRSDSQLGPALQTLRIVQRGARELSEPRLKSREHVQHRLSDRPERRPKRDRATDAWLKSELALDLHVVIRPNVHESDTNEFHTHIERALWSTLPDRVGGAIDQSDGPSEVDGGDKCRVDVPMLVRVGEVPQPPQGLAPIIAAIWLISPDEQPFSIRDAGRSAFPLIPKLGQVPGEWELHLFGLLRGQGGVRAHLHQVPHEVVQRRSQTVHGVAHDQSGFTHVGDARHDQARFPPFELALDRHGLGVVCDPAKGGIQRVEMSACAMKLGPTAGEGRPIRHVSSMRQRSRIRPSFAGTGHGQAADKIHQGSPTIDGHPSHPLAIRERLVPIKTEPSQFDRDFAPHKDASDVLATVEPYALIFEGDALVPGEGHRFNSGDQLRYARVGAGPISSHLSPSDRVSR